MKSPLAPASSLASSPTRLPRDFTVDELLEVALTEQGQMPAADKLATKREQALQVATLCNSLLPAIRRCRSSEVPSMLEEKSGLIGLWLKTALVSTIDCLRKAFGSPDLRSVSYRQLTVGTYNHYRDQKDDQKYKMLGIVTQSLIGEIASPFDPNKPLLQAFSDLREKLMSALSPDVASERARRLFTVRVLGRDIDMSQELRTTRGRNFQEFRNVWDDALYTLYHGLGLLQTALNSIKPGENRGKVDKAISDIRIALKPILYPDLPRGKGILADAERSKRSLTTDEMKLLLHEMPPGRMLNDLSFQRISQLLQEVESSMMKITYGGSEYRDAFGVRQRDPGPRETELKHVLSLLPEGVALSPDNTPIARQVLKRILVSVHPRILIAAFDNLDPAEQRSDFRRWLRSNAIALHDEIKREKPV